MDLDLRKLALRFKVIEILNHYSKIRHQMHIMRQWKKLLINPN